MYTAKFDKYTRKADATLCASHVFVTQEAIIHDSLVSDIAKPASDQFGGNKADMSGYNCSVRWPPCKLNISCTSTTAESRAKIWYQ